MAAFLASAYGQNTAGSSIASKTLLSSDGARKVEQRVYDNGLGDIVQMITRTVPMIPADWRELFFYLLSMKWDFGVLTRFTKHAGIAW